MAKLPFINDDFDDEFSQTQSTDSAQPKQPKQPTAEELRAQQDEQEMRETVIERSPNRLRILFTCVTVVAIVTVVGWLWLRYFRPYKVSQERGVIMEMNTSGYLKTFEGKMMSERLIDSTHTYQTDFLFSTTNDSVAKVAASLAGTGRRVTVYYEEFKGLRLWRGETPRFVTAIVPDGGDTTGVVPATVEQTEKQPVAE